MKTIKHILLALIVISAFSCKEEPKELDTTNLEPVISTFYLIRHADKDRSNPDNPDPELNQEGLGRAIRWERVFSEIPLDEVYSTDFERTLMTAEPTVINQDKILKKYNPSTLDVEEFKTTNLGLNVLVVGHSNTIPDFVNKLIGEEKYSEIDDYDYSSLFIVRIIDGKATDIRLKMD